MSELKAKQCLPCEGLAKALKIEVIMQLLQKIPSWELELSEKAIFKRFKFKNFYQVMAFVNAVAWIAQQENHHPDLAVSYSECTVKYWTHAVTGLTENDFICAAKVEALIDLG